MSVTSVASQNGLYYALVIGINRYQHEPPLQTAVNDAKAIEALLRERYGFQTKLLLDADATRGNILNALGQYRRMLMESDSLLIYYAGHGTRDGDKAYWLPVDSDPDSTANWIIADDITTGTRVIPARHVLIVSDSCYSGGLSRSVDANVLAANHNAAIAKMLSSRSRVLISSGRDEPVTDRGNAGHSVFADALLRGLTNMKEQSFTALSLFDQYVRESVIGGSEQVPLYQMIQNSGHEGGDFVFFPRSVASSGSLPQHRSVTVDSAAPQQSAPGPAPIESAAQQPPTEQPKPIERPNPEPIKPQARELEEPATSNPSNQPEPGRIAQPTAAHAPQRVRVGGIVQAANLIRNVSPAYPSLAKQARIQGTVHFMAVIGQDGTVQELQLVSGHPLLVPAATEAVKQWLYRPTVLNGNPVEVITQIDVTFSLAN